jgi:hypothetical protein
MERHRRCWEEYFELIKLCVCVCVGFKVYLHIFMAVALEGGGIGLRYGRFTYGGETVLSCKGGRRWIAFRVFHGRYEEEKNRMLMLKIESRIFGRRPVAVHRSGRKSV